MKTIIKNMVFAGFILFALGWFNPVANASTLDDESLLSTKAVQEIRDVALTYDDVLLVETKQIKDLKMNDGYISLNVTLKDGKTTINILNDDLSEKTVNLIKLDADRKEKAASDDLLMTPLRGLIIIFAVYILHTLFDYWGVKHSK